MSAREQGDPQNRRREPRTAAALKVTSSTMDPVRDSVTREVCYQISEHDTTLNLSRRGMRLRCDRPPEVGTRLLLQIQPGQAVPPIEIIGRTCWTRVEYQQGVRGACPYAAVGVELVGGSRGALARYGHCLSQLEEFGEARVPTGARDEGIESTAVLKHPDPKAPAARTGEGPALPAPEPPGEPSPSH